LPTDTGRVAARDPVAIPYHTTFKKRKFLQKASDPRRPLVKSKESSSLGTSLSGESDEGTAANTVTQKEERFQKTSDL
jgi:hypothetical protein